MAVRELSQTTAKASEFPPLTCYVCGGQFPAKDFYRPIDPMCPACDRQRVQLATLRENERKMKQREAAWQTLCPHMFIGTVRGTLPNPSASDKTLRWVFSPIGMLLHGKTGSGKSRTVWMLLKANVLAGKTVAVLNSLSAIQYAASFSQSAKDAFSQSAKDVEAWIMPYIQADILFMDDPFKNKITESFESALFSVIDQRTQNGRPIIATVNDTGDTLKERLSGDRGEPLIRRLREFCESIAF